MLLYCCWIVSWKVDVYHVACVLGSIWSWFGRSPLMSSHNWFSSDTTCIDVSVEYQWKWHISTTNITDVTIGKALPPMHQWRSYYPNSDVRIELHPFYLLHELYTRIILAHLYTLCTKCMTNETKKVREYTFFKWYTKRNYSLITRNNCSSQKLQRMNLWTHTHTHIYSIIRHWEIQSNSKSEAPRATTKFLYMHLHMNDIFYNKLTITDRKWMLKWW